MTRVLSLVVMLALVLAAAPARAADIDGRWTGSFDTPMGAVNVAFTFKADGGTLTGSSTGPDGMDVPIKNGKIDGDRISFVLSLDFGGMPFDLNYTGALMGDTLQLTADFMGMPFSFAVKKAQ